MTYLLPGTVFSLLPVFAFAYLVRIFSPSGGGAFYTLLLVLSQVISAIWLSSAFSLTTGWRIERTLLIGLVVLYGTVMVIIFRSGVT